ncbi:exodeoxyribonuclease VII small subunit [Williamsia muralis]|uniref:exodeoxyribonuclease VII small subunit n=1 Tax=Williamsia marianensis TaxID=85044 RepID=UPI0037FF3EDB
MAAKKQDIDGPVPVSELGYEQARDELIVVVRTLEQGGLDLDASLELWERGEALSRRCEEHLEGARKRIEAVLGSEEDLADADDEDDDFDDQD